MFQGGVAVVEGDPAVESLIDLHFGAGEAEAVGLLGDLEAAAFPLHDVVVPDSALVHEAADAIEAVRRGSPGGFHLAGHFGETAVVVEDEAAQNGVGGVEVVSSSQAEFAAQAILQHAPEALDAAFGLRTVGGDKGDAELTATTSPGLLTTSAKS